MVPARRARPSAGSANGSQREQLNDYVLPGDLAAGWGAAAGALDTEPRPDRRLPDGRLHLRRRTRPRSRYRRQRRPTSCSACSPLEHERRLDKIDERRGTSTVVDDYGFPDQPMLDEMTDKALEVLSKEPRTASCSWSKAPPSTSRRTTWTPSAGSRHHRVRPRHRRWPRSSRRSNPDTLVIVTADHECAGVAIIGATLNTATPSAASVGTYDAASFPKYTINADGYPQTTDIAGKMVIGYGGNADRYHAETACQKQA